jgi:hypothetical protein
MKLTLGLLAYAMLLSPAQSPTLPDTLPKSSGAVHPLPAVEKLSLPLTMPTLATTPAKPASGKPSARPAISVGPSYNGWSRQTSAPAPRWNTYQAWKSAQPDTSRPVTGAFVAQDVHVKSPVEMLSVATPPPDPVPPAEEPAPVVWGSLHSLTLTHSVAPVVYSTQVTSRTTKLPVPNQGAQNDYRKIIGQLMYVHVNGGRWVVRYAGLDQEDRYGGSVVLEPSAELEQLTEGDVVCVQGEVLNEGRAERPLGAPLYRVQSIQRLSGGRN